MVASRSSRRSRRNNNDERGDNSDDTEENLQEQRLNVLPDVVRDRQRAVAEREASRLARPENRSKSLYGLSHADRKKSAVTSTPSGIGSLAPAVASNKRNKDESERNYGDEENNTNETANGTEEWCGPWSVARQMIAKREDAKRKRQEELENDDNGNRTNGENHPLDEAMEELILQRKRQAHPSMQWKSALVAEMKGGMQSSLYGKRQKRMDTIRRGKKVPTLFQLCISYLANNVDCIESLGVDSTDSDDIRTAVMDQLIADQLLNDDAITVLAESGIDTLTITDGSNISEECLIKHLQLLLQSGLKKLTIDQCGRCFTASTVQSIINTTSTNEDNLQHFMIGGAYGLQDRDAALLVQHIAPESLGFKACNLLSTITCESICNTYDNKPYILKELFLEDIPLTTDDMKVFIRHPGAWKHLTHLSLRRINGLDDAFLHDFFQLCCNTLEYLDLTENVELTDAILASLRYHNIADRLHTLNLQGLKLLTAIGLEAFFTTTVTASEIDDISSSHSQQRQLMLQSLNLGQCSHDAVTDEVIRLVVGCAPTLEDPLPMESVNDEELTTSNSYLSHTKYSFRSVGTSSGGLVHLNVQGSSLLTDTAMEYLASNKCSTYRTLKNLNISFCPKITDQGLGYLIDSCQPQLRTIHVWGNAQLTDNVFDGHQRIDDPTLEVVGIWMKKASSRTIR